VQKTDNAINGGRDMGEALSNFTPWSNGPELEAGSPRLQQPNSQTWSKLDAIVVFALVA
jgi:hypothetical protein